MKLKSKKKNKLYKILMFPLMAIGVLLGSQGVHAMTTNLTMNNSDWYRSYEFKGVYASWHLTDYSFNGRTAFCIDPNVEEGTSYQTTSDFSITNYTNQQKERALLIAYYGYDYPNHQTRAYRAATQALLWENAGTTTVRFSSERYEHGTIYDVSAERNEIERLISEHYRKPSFNGKSFTANVGETITLTDENNILSNYEVYSSNNAQVSINGNKLTVRPTAVGKINIRFAKKQYTSQPYLLYYSPEHQKMLSAGAIDPVYSDVNIESLGGKVDLVKLDKDLNKAVPQGEATLKGAVYGVYDADTDALIQRVTTNEKGIAISSNLPKLGKFYLKEITPSEGYQLDKTKYYFTSTLESPNASLKVKEDVITRDFEFTKVYASDKTQVMTPEVGVQFGIYNNKGELVKKVTTDHEGKFYVTLPYGHYTLRQLTSSKDYEKLDDYHFEVKDLGDTVNKVLSNAEITARLKVIKVDADSGKIIARANIKFRIFDVIHNKYVSQTITYPHAETIDVFSTDSNGILITPYPLHSGTYRLEEVDQPIDGYLWNKESKEFVIGENSKLITNPEYGIIFEVKFENKQVMGEVNVEKHGEKVVIEDGTYHYEDVELDGVTYKLYANEDIYSADGTLVYKKNALVGTYVTKDGKLSITGLYLGKYYLVESATVDGHVLDSTKHYFTLKYKDQYTPVISLSFSFKNYLEKGTLEFDKTDVAGNPLPNTKIQIYAYDEDINDAKLVFEGVTDENGKIVIKDLFVSKYFLVESEAPEGYVLNPEKQLFEIKANGDIVKCNMVNELIVKVPDTGISDSKVLNIIGSILIIAGVGFVIYDKKKKK